MIETGVTNRNFIRLLKAGAFGKADGEMEPMSDYKWKMLFANAGVHGVGSFIIKGAEMHRADKWFNYKGSISDLEFDEEPDINKGIDRVLRIGVKDVDGMYTSLSNGRMRKKLDDIIYDEIHGDETNLPALHLLCIIVYNINVTLTQGMRMNGIVAMGHYLRDKGDRVDYVKLDSWLSRLMMVHFADLFASVLMDVFDFDESEIPFMHHHEDNVAALMTWTFDSHKNEINDDSYLMQLTSGFSANERRAHRRSLKRGLRYMKYYPVETVSNFFSKIFKNLPEIEE